MLNIKLPSEIMSISEEQQNRFRVNLLNIIEETFVFTADEDYVTARMLALTGMHRMFYWSASQTLEKYFKALLLQQGFSVKKLSHEIDEIFSENLTVFNFLNAVDLTLPRIIKEKYEGLEVLASFDSVEHFIKHIKEYGTPDNRYNQIGVEYDTTALILLDRIVWKIQEKIVRSEFIEDRVKKMNASIAIYFDKHHEFFEPYEPSSISLHNTVTHLELVLKDCYGYQSYYEKWLNENTKIKNINQLKQK